MAYWKGKFAKNKIHILVVNWAHGKFTNMKHHMGDHLSLGRPEVILNILNMLLDFPFAANIVQWKDNGTAEKHSSDQIISSNN